MKRAASGVRGRKRLVVAITGASGAAYGVRLLRELGAVSGWESHLVLSEAGALNCWHELRMKRKDWDETLGRVIKPAQQDDDAPSDENE